MSRSSSDGDHDQVDEREHGRDDEQKRQGQARADGPERVSCLAEAGSRRRAR